MKYRTVSSLFLFTYCSNVYADSNLVADPSKDNSAQCDCYLASGVDPGYFQYHRFWDFRNISNDGDDDYTQAPALLTSSVSGDETITSSYFNSTSFTTDWSISSGKQNRNSPLSAIDTPQNLYISRNSTTGAEASTYMTFRTQRVDDTSVATVELDSKQTNILHASVRGRFRVIPNSLDQASAPYAGDRTLTNDTQGTNETHPVDSGAVFGFFTYLSDTQESDIEILTADPINNIRYSNQPDYDAKTDMSVPGASTQAIMPTGTDWTQWQDHRIDWFDGVSRWYVNDQLVLEKTLNVPTKPSGFIVNLWSDGGNWSGNMSIGAQVTVGVQWIEMAFNTSGKLGSQKRDLGSLEKRKASICGTGCNIDSVAKVGFPETAFQGPASGASIMESGRELYVTVGVALLMSMLIAFV